MLTDLDELVLTVRDRASRTYIDEAIAAYRARAYRAAIVSTWVAVSFDILGKLRVLASQGDKAAEKCVAELDNAIENKNLGRLQAIENGLLTVAESDFEFIGTSEAEDLARLLKDRNRCAHPAFTGEATLFTPTAEQVRAHIAHAILHLLQHPPVQGKAALARIKADLLQASFPTDRARARDFMATKYLDHARASLLETLVCVLLKVDTDLAKHKDRVLAALAAIESTSPDTYERRTREELPKLTHDLDDAGLANVLLLVGSAPTSWGRLPHSVRLRLEELAGKGEFETSEGAALINLLGLAPLRPAILGAFRRVGDQRQMALIALTPRAELAEDAIRLYAGSTTYRGAESAANKVIMPMAPHFTAQDVGRVLESVQQNGQIWDAAATPDQLERFFRETSRHHHEAAGVWWNLWHFARGMPTSVLGRAADRLRGWLEGAGLGPAPAVADAVPAEAN